MAVTAIKINSNDAAVDGIEKLWGSGFHPHKRKTPEKLLHRSDMLFNEQLQAAHQAINEFAYVAENYESAPTIFEKEEHLLDIFVYNRLIQHLKIVLEILGNINKEIKFGRNKLHAAVKNHSEDAELIRQRISWLERRLETIVKENTFTKLIDFFKKPDGIKTLLAQNDFDQVGKKQHMEGLVRSQNVVSPPKSILQGTSTRTYLQQRKAVTLPPIVPETAAIDLSQDDEAEKYWQGDHHRFSYTENMGPLLQENPISYHSIGLAVPGNYVDRCIFSADGEKHGNLPWTSEQDPMKGKFDISRDDLEKLLKKIHRIQEKIYLAANLSVNFDPTVTSEKGVKPQSRELSRQQERSPQTGLSSTVSITGENRGTSRSIVAGSLARISSSATPNSSSRTSSSDSFLPINFYAENEAGFPLTKTNLGKKYPHCCDRWCDARPSEHGTANQPTIVDQHDLLNKTKLRLFIPKRLKQRNNIARDLITPSSVTSNRSFRKVNNTVRFVEKLKSYGGNSLSEMQKDRIHELLATLSTSERVDDRIYAARSLSSLGVTASDDVAPLLVENLGKENSPLVRYEISKAVINLGEWNSGAIKELNQQLLKGVKEVCLDVLEHLSCSEGATTMHLQIDELPQLKLLIETLQAMVQKTDLDEEISFQAAVCLGVLCGIYDEKSAMCTTKKLLGVVQSTKNWSWSAQALEVLVKRLNHCDEVTLKAIITQMNKAIKWQDRLAAALLLGYIGPSSIFRIMSEDDIFSILDAKIWDDAKREVRVGVSQAFTSLGMRQRLLEALDERINAPSAEIRSRAVMSMSAAGIRSDKTLRSLVEMLGLDSSDYVRLQIIRMFHALGITDIRVVRALREREKGGGPLGREASKVLAALNVRLTTAASSGNSRQRSRGSRRLDTSNSKRAISSSWASSPWGRNVHTGISDFRGRNKSGSPTRSRRFTPGSGLSSAFDQDLSPPHYQIVSTAVQKLRLSAQSMRRNDSRRTHLTSASSFF